MDAPWKYRCLHISVAFDGALWVMGGQTSYEPQLTHPREAVAETFYSDVWRSADGSSWTRVADDCPWGPRGMIGGQAVKDGRMYIIGGGTYATPDRPGRTYTNDVWSSADGRSWHCHTEEAPWEPRSYHDVAVFDEKLWVIAGANFGGRSLAHMRGPKGVDLELLHINPATGKPDANRNGAHPQPFHVAGTSLESVKRQVQRPV